MLVETDAPFLAPVPHRGRTCEPAYHRRHRALRRRAARASRPKRWPKRRRAISSGCSRKAARVKLIMLGSGTSTGVPRISARTARTGATAIRPSRGTAAPVSRSWSKAMPAQRLLVDTSPDLRSQLLATGIDRIDAVFWTHDHADHCHGIDDLRPMRYGRAGPIARLCRGRDGAAAAPALRLCLRGSIRLSRRSSRSTRSSGCGSAPASQFRWCQMPHGHIAEHRLSVRAAMADQSAMRRISALLPREMVAFFDGCRSSWSTACAASRIRRTRISQWRSNLPRQHGSGARC